ncbi:hypothetical protein GFH30_09995 [Acinetobacter wanghuae]|uniref:Transmembrane protein n=1 Tax=Acinetobacter wanghuae TaxID=2662362 RepID=A0A5Q0P3J5_9GAMM|nr:DUF4870 domain-containing protein [Acinetobacter wanghuae]MQW91408.1 hypothetical protein [Acinetobacter wanghuae]QGA11689.1 hypothetical protein GFH30_09995 [Acinetobacter wanghuae]
MQDTANLKQHNLITYILYLLGFVFGGLTNIIAIIMNYLKRDECRGTWLESHIEWQIKTFWVTLIGYIVGFVLSFVLIGIPILIVVLVWHIYRIVKGLMALNDNKAIT